MLHEETNALIIGPSSHSPIPQNALLKIVPHLAQVFILQTISFTRQVLQANNVFSLWFGGDPEFKVPSRGGNISNLVTALQKQHIVPHFGIVDDRF